MHLTILALGSHGDILPFTVLGKGFSEAGHQVRIVTFEIFKEMVESQGLDFATVKGDAQALMGSDARVPTLVFPFVVDQFFWGKRVYELGAGPRTIPMKRLNTETLCAAIDEILHNDEMRRKAVVQRDQLRTEDGVSNAISVIHQYT